MATRPVGATEARRHRYVRLAAYVHVSENNVQVSIWKQISVIDLAIPFLVSSRSMQRAHRPIMAIGRAKRAFTSVPTATFDCNRQRFTAVRKPKYTPC